MSSLIPGQVVCRRNNLLMNGLGTRLDICHDNSCHDNGGVVFQDMSSLV